MTEQGAQAPLFNGRRLPPGKMTESRTTGLKSMLYFSLGDFVRHPGKPEWGIGQVQSIVGMNVTVNFPNAGKQMINCAIVELEKVGRADETP
jgi:hypothetical protein